MTLNLSSLVDCQDFCDVLSPFFNLPDLDHLCRVSRDFKVHFLVAGHHEACKMHKVGLCHLLFLDRVSHLEPWFSPNLLAIKIASASAHQQAVNKTGSTQLSPLPLYRCLIKNTEANIFHDFCRRFHLSKFLECENRIRLFFSVYYSLQQARVCLPEQWALATRLSVQPIRISELISKMGSEFISCHEKNIILDPDEVDAQLKCMIKITELNPSVILRSASQLDLVTLCTKLGKLALAQRINNYN